MDNYLDIKKHVIKPHCQQLFAKCDVVGFFRQEKLIP